MKNDIEKQKFYYPTKFLLCFLTGVCMLAFSAYSVEGMAAGSWRGRSVATSFSRDGCGNGF